MVACGGVKQVELALARDDLNPVGTDHVVDGIGIDASRVHDRTAQDVTGGGVEAEAAIRAVDARHLGVKAEGDAVCNRALRHATYEAEGVGDARRRRVEGAHGLIGDVWLHLLELVALDDTQALNAVPDASVEQRLEGRSAILARTHDEGAAAVVRDPQLVAEREHEPVALDVEPCHERASLGVIARVDERGIGLRGALADVVRTFQHQDVSVASRELPGNRAARYARADNDDVVHRNWHEPLLSTPTSQRRVYCLYRVLWTSIRGAAHSIR